MCGVVANHKHHLFDIFVKNEKPYLWSDPTSGHVTRTIAFQLGQAEYSGCRLIGYTTIYKTFFQELPNITLLLGWQNKNARNKTSSFFATSVAVMEGIFLFYDSL